MHEKANRFAVMFRAMVLFAFLQLSLPQHRVWPKQYAVSGQIILSYGDINEPFTATVDMIVTNISRGDYRVREILYHLGSKS